MRLFSSAPSAHWYLELVSEVVAPFAGQHPEGLLFLSQYSIGAGLTDDGDTTIADLPGPFQNPVPNIDHRSVRIRFRNSPTIEDELAKAVASANSACVQYWYSEFLDYDFEHDLMSLRWAPVKREDSDRLRRARLVANVLCANTRLLLDAIVSDGGVPRFERNTDDLNLPLQSTAYSLAHMVLQAWIDDTWVDAGGRRVKHVAATGQYTGLLA